MPAARLIAESQSSPFAWERLALLGDTFGHRLSGSEALENAIKWAVGEMKKDGLDNVRAEPVKVPHWVRGQESVEITLSAPIGARHARSRQQRRHASRRHRGRGAGRPLVCRARRGGRGVRGKIVALQRPLHHLWRNGAIPRRRPIACGEARRRRHARSARSALPGLRTPHTGALRYADGTPQIPAAAIAVEDAERLQRMQNRGTKVRLRLKMEAKFLPDADSANVVGEIRGRERPDESHRRWRPLRLVGRRDRIDRRWRWLRGDVGSAAADEEAESAAAPHRARRALHQRRKRPGRRTRLPRATARSSSPTTC